MFFRFGSAIVLVVLIALAGVALEKESLELRRTVSRQYYRMDVLADAHARLRLRTQELGAPARLIGPVESGKVQLAWPRKPLAAAPRRPPVPR